MSCKGSADIPCCMGGAYGMSHWSCVLTSTAELHGIPFRRSVNVLCGGHNRLCTIICAVMKIKVLLHSLLQQNGSCILQYTAHPDASERHSDVQC